jgi:RNA polymerase sigma-70 factor (ECF subfamily)
LQGRPPNRGAAPAEDVVDSVDFPSLCEQHRPRLYALCLTRLRDPALADDVVQDVFAKAFAVLPRFDPRRPFWPWLASIAARECIDAHRRRVVATARHTELSVAAPLPSPTSTSQAALSRFEYAAVRREVERLAPRQRAALQLFAVDGWSYAEIADRLGCSIGTVKLLIVRARARLREARARLSAGLGGIGRGLGARLQGLWERAAGVASRSWPWSWPAGGTGAGGLEMSAALALVVTGSLLGMPAPSAGHPELSPSAGNPGVVAASMPSQAASAAPAAGDTRAWTEPAVQAQSRAAQRAAHDIADTVPLGDEGTASDDQPVQRFTVSPGYGTDRTVFAVDGEWRLTVSHDGGASWSRLRARGLEGARLLLPPEYPRDNRIFALGQAGLQSSDNDGDTFEVVAPGRWSDAALSPGFDAGDPTVLLVGGGLWRYDSRSGLTEPVLLDEPMAGHVVAGVRYDLADPRHRTVHLVSHRPLSSGVESGEGEQVVVMHTFHLGTCKLPVGPGPMSCTTERLRDGLTSFTGLVASPLAPGMLLVRGGSTLLVSTDGGRTFRATAPWEGKWLLHRDAAAVPGAAASFVVAFAGTDHDDPALLRTDDGGASWTPLPVDLPGFADGPERVRGAGSVAVTPTGRILAGGSDGGLACSVDGGRTWASLCPTPDA